MTVEKTNKGSSYAYGYPNKYAGIQSRWSQTKSSVAEHNSHSLSLIFRTNYSQSLPKQYGASSQQSCTKSKLSVLHKRWNSTGMMDPHTTTGSSNVNTECYQQTTCLGMCLLVLTSVLSTMSTPTQSQEVLRVQTASDWSSDKAMSKRWLARCVDCYQSVSTSHITACVWDVFLIMNKTRNPVVFLRSYLVSKTSNPKWNVSYRQQKKFMSQHCNGMWLSKQRQHCWSFSYE